MATNIDEFAADLLEESKRFLELAKISESNGDHAGRQAYLHATIMLAFCGLEAHINAVADEMLLTKGLSVHDRAVLQERDVRLEDGKFRLRKELKIYRLEDRILFLHSRFSAQPLDKSTWLSALKTATGFRNQLTHPKGVATPTISNAESAILAIIAVIDALYMAIYKKSFPAKARGIQSKLTFGI